MPHSPSPILRDINRRITYAVPPQIHQLARHGHRPAILAYFSLPSYRLAEPSIAGKLAQDFALTINGEPSHLSDLKGKFVVLNFWASYCGTCVEEIPSLNRLHQRVASRGGVVLGVSIDEDPSAYHKFLANHPVSFPTYCDPTNTKVALSYGTSMIPETYLIDRQGRIYRKIIGSQQWDSSDMLAYFDATLASH
jgi:cytochrome c biogenesis protein CcmG/thiol:disulfide interchange protein DsbE